MNPAVLHWGAWVVMPVMAAFGSWWGASMRIVRLQTLLEAHIKEMDAVKREIDRAHSRLDRFMNRQTGG